LRFYQDQACLSPAYWTASCPTEQR